MMKTEVTSRELAKLLGLTSSRITELRKRKIIIPGNKRGTWLSFCDSLSPCDGILWRLARL
ncbi:MAG: hypothetical protein WBE89_03350, partial [Methyloceanibacter sp.]